MWQKICENDTISIFQFLFYSQIWLKFSFICFTSSNGWPPLCFAIFPWMIITCITSSYGRSPLVLHLPMNDCHLFYILLWMITTCFTSSHGWRSLVLKSLLWMITTCFTSSHGWWPFVLHLPMDDDHKYSIFPSPPLPQK